ncbi:MAG: hypothetical protein ACK4UO_19475 [Pseudolabrys sp.]
MPGAGFHRPVKASPVLAFSDADGCHAAGTDCAGGSPDSLASPSGGKPLETVATPLTFMD